MTRQTNVFKMMIKAYGDYQDMAEKAFKADGATESNQEKYADSLKGKLGELSATWEKIGDSTLNAPLAKGLVDIGNGITNVIDKVGLLETAIAGLATYKLSKNGLD